MSINPRDILFYGGGAALAKYGTLTRRLATARSGGEEAKEVWTRAGGGALQRTRAGLYVAAGANIPRIERLDLDNDGIFETPTLLEEAAATNYLLRSEEFDNAAWSKGSTSVSANVVASPDGTVSADKLVEDGTNSDHYIYQQIAIASGDPVSGSIFLQAKERSRLYVSICDTVSQVNKLATQINLAAGTVSAVSLSGAATANGPATITKLGGGWYRITLSGKINAGATTANLLIVLENNSGATPYAGDGSSGLYLWGAQLERATIASGYIKTVAASASRSADTATIPFYSPPQASSWYLKFEDRGQRFGPTFGNLIQVGSVSGSTEFLSFRNNGGATYDLDHGYVQFDEATSGTLSSNPLDIVEMLGNLYADGSVQLFYTINGAAIVACAKSGAPTGGPAHASWGGSQIQITGNGYAAIVAFVGVRAPNNVFPSLADFQALLPPFGPTL